MISPKTTFAFLLTMVLLSGVCFASVQPASYRIGDASSELTEREQKFNTREMHDSNFSTMSRVTVRTSCEAAQPPEALATPDPLLDGDAARRTTVTFIIGIDGRVHSPLILESLGPSGDRIVLDAVRTWRYRPATCNGVPTEVEGKIAFSSR